MDSVSGVGVLDKAVGLLRTLRTHGPMGLAELHEATGLPRATAHRLAVALEEHGLIRRDDVGRFCLGFELIALGRAAADAFALGDIGRPLLTGLRDETGESVQLFVREGDERRCVVSLQSPHGLRWIVPEGARLPLSLGSAGRVLSATTGAGDGADSGHSGELYVVESVEEREPGVASVSAAVLSRSRAVIAAVSVSGPVERLTRHPAQRFGSAVADCAAALSTLFIDSGLH